MASLKEARGKPYLWGTPRIGMKTEDFGLGVLSR